MSESRGPGCISGAVPLLRQEPLAGGLPAFTDGLAQSGRATTLQTRTIGGRVGETWAHWAGATGPAPGFPPVPLCPGGVWQPVWPCPLRKSHDSAEALALWDVRVALMFVTVQSGRQERVLEF